MTELAPSDEAAFAALVVVVTCAPYALESWMPVAPRAAASAEDETLAFGANGAPPYQRSALYDVVPPCRASLPGAPDV